MKLIGILPVIFIAILSLGCFLDPKNPDSPDTRLVGSWKFLKVISSLDPANYSDTIHNTYYTFGYSGNGSYQEEKYNYILASGEKNSMVDEKYLFVWKVENSLLLIYRENVDLWISHNYSISYISSGTYTGDALNIDGVEYER